MKSMSIENAYIFRVNNVHPGFVTIFAQRQKSAPKPKFESSLNTRLKPGAFFENTKLNSFISRKSAFHECIHTLFQAESIEHPFHSLLLFL